MAKPHPMKLLLTASLLFGIFVLFSLPDLGRISHWPPDADKIAMDGVFIFDFIKDIPHSLLHPRQYAIEYYARYPSLSAGQRPLFFPAVEALFYGIAGLNILAPRVAVLLFLFIGMLFWVLLVTGTHDVKIAVLSLLLWISNPHIYLYSQNILLEIPTLSMSILTLYLLYQYVSAPSGRTGIFLGVAAGLMLWTNQKSAFMLPMFFLYPLCSKKPKIFLAGSTWMSAAVIILFLFPLTIMTLRLGDHNIALALNNHSSPRQTQLLQEGHSQFFVYLYYLYHDHFSLPILLLAISGMGIAVFKKDGNSILYGLMIFCVYLTFTLISVKIPRYAIYWIPCFCFFAALAILEIAGYLSHRIKKDKIPIPYILCSLPVIFQLGTSFPIHVRHVSGYEAAARYVLEQSGSPVLFFTGMGNGQFSFFVRKHDPEKNFMILRGQKIISTSFVHHAHDTDVYLHNPEEIYNTLQKMGVQYAVVESPLHAPDIPAYKALTALLEDSNHFTLRKTVPVNITPALRGKDHKLLIYENRNPAPINRNQTLILHIPAAGRTLKVTLGDMLEKGIK